MEKISAVIIALNEQRRIADAIDSLQGVADEIIVVDSFSTDATVDIALEKGCRVERRRFDGFGAQRQYATSLASNRYVLFLDADEVLSPALRKSLTDLKSRPFEHRVYAFSRLNFFAGNPVRHCGWYPDTQVRLFDKRYATYNFHDINERVIFPDTLTPFPLEGDILHYRCNSRAEYRDKLTAHARIHAGVIAASGRTLHTLRPHIEAVKAFIGSYIAAGGIFEGESGRAIAAEHYNAALLSFRLARSLRHASAQ